MSETIVLYGPCVHNVRLISHYFYLIKYCANKVTWLDFFLIFSKQYDFTHCLKGRLNPVPKKKAVVRVKRTQMVIFRFKKIQSGRFLKILGKLWNIY